MRSPECACAIPGSRRANTEMSGAAARQHVPLEKCAALGSVGRVSNPPLLKPLLIRRGEALPRPSFRVPAREGDACVAPTNGIGLRCAASGSFGNEISAACHQQLQMPHRERAVPFPIEVFTHEPTVAVMRLRLGAQETRSVEQLRLKTMLDSSFRHEVEKTRLVSRPLPLVLLVGLEHGVRRREQRLMHIRDPADPVEEIGEVIGLGKTGELRGIVQAHVDHLLHPADTSRSKNRSALVCVKPLVATLAFAKSHYSAAMRPCRWPAPGAQWLGMRLCNPGRPTNEYHEPRRDSTRMVACSDIRVIVGAPARVRLARIKLAAFRLGFVWPRRHAVAGLTTYGSAIRSSL
jgi:hypothetical protein